jgi:tRNA(Ile)-lysidine synthase
VDAYSIFLRTVQRHRLIGAGHRVLAAVSGGPDSMALLHFLVRARRSTPFELAVAHLDHGLRGEASTADAAFVEEVAREHRLTLLGERLPEVREDSSHVPEDRLRTARLRFLYRMAAGWEADRIALGHTRDDQAETLALNLIRGAGTRGLGGMPVLGPAREMPGGEVAPSTGNSAARKTARTIRPLLLVSRAALVQWLEKEELGWREDSTNEDPRYLRNRVRRELLPLLERLRPGATAAIARSAHLLQEDDAVLERLAEEVQVETDPAGARLDAGRLRELPRPLARRVLRQAARAAGEKPDNAGRPDWRPGARQVEEVLDLIAARRGGRVDLGRGHAAVVKGGSVVIETGAKAASEAVHSHLQADDIY